MPEVDPAFAALLADPRVALRRLPGHVPLAALREGANAFMAGVPRPPIHAVADLTIPGAGAARLYRPSAASGLPIILFVHGGGFLLGNLETHDALCRALAAAADAAVVAVDYRLAPEAPHPAALDDIAAAYRALPSIAAAHRLDDTRVSIAGDSAGGLLAASAALMLPFRRVALFYPMVDHRQTTASLRMFATDHMLTAEFIAWAWEAYGARSPLIDADLSAYPPTTLVTAECDPLRDEGETFAARLRAAGRDVWCERFAGMIHGFAGMPHLTPRAQDAVDLLAARLRA